MNDAMRQVLDFFDLLNAVGGNEARSVIWTLVDVSMNSPLQVTGEAIAASPGVQAEVIARQEKSALANVLTRAVEGNGGVYWTEAATRSLAKQFFERNTRSIGRTDIDFYNNNRPIIISQNVAKRAVDYINIAEDFRISKLIDLSRHEYGSIEAVIASVTKHYGKPALRVLERLTGDEVLCLIGNSLASILGEQHTWSEAWSDKRLLLTGDLTYKSDGRLAQIKVDEIEAILPKSLRYDDIARPNFTDGLSPKDYIASLWEDDVD